MPDSPPDRVAAFLQSLIPWHAIPAFMGCLSGRPTFLLHEVTVLETQMHFKMLGVYREKGEGDLKQNELRVN